MVVESIQEDNLIDFTDLCQPYIRGRMKAAHWPLARYLPEVPSGLVSNWVSQKIPPGSLILDPFGSSPSILVDLAHQGYRVVTCMLNPVIRLILEVGSRVYSKTEYQSALSELFNSKKENTRFDLFMQSFYVTKCSSCGKLIQVDEYGWDRGAAYPFAVIYDCPECGTHNEHEPGEMDKELLDRVTRSPLFRPLAMDRIVGSDPDLKSDAQEVLSCHLSRPLYLIVAIFSRLEGLAISREKKKILQSLILTAMDSSNTLWPVDQPDYRPLQLNVPPHFLEFNLWKVLSKIADAGAPSRNRVMTLRYPDLPSPGEISIYPGRARDLLGLDHPDHYDAVVTATPRPNQAFWKLSAAWSAWMLGEEDIHAFTRIISRDRYDWSWHANALFNTYQILHRSNKMRNRFYSLLPEIEPAFLSCVIPAAHKGGWNLTSFALGPEDHMAEVIWERSDLPSEITGNIYRTVVKGSLSYLKFKGEPADYMEMTCASLLQLEKAGQIISEHNGNSVQTQLRTAFSDPGVFLHIGPGEQTLESGHWWLKSHYPVKQTYSDFVELQTLQILNEGSEVTPESIEDRIRANAPVSFCEVRQYIRHLLASYAKQVSQNANSWKIKERELCDCRREEVDKLKEQINNLGIQLNCTVEGEHPIIWRDKFFSPIYKFYIYSHTAFLGELLQDSLTETPGILVLPASRLNLLAYKHKENTAMNQLLSRDWRIVKFRLMSRLAENPLVTLESFGEMLKADPVENNPDQLFLF